MADEIEFGTGGWRAIIADTFTRLNVERVAQALADRIHDENQEHRPVVIGYDQRFLSCLLYTSPSPRDKRQSRMPSSA